VHDGLERRCPNLVQVERIIRGFIDLTHDSTAAATVGEGAVRCAGLLAKCRHAGSDY
jgi:hypothetical protein